MTLKLIVFVIILSLFSLKIYTFVPKFNICNLKLYGKSQSNKIAVIKDEDILNLPIPLLPDSIQSTIADLLQKSIRHKKKSLELLNDAVKLVEKEIEKNIDNK